MAPQLIQQSIYQTLLHELFPAHNSMEDVRALRRIALTLVRTFQDMLTENMSTGNTVRRKRHEIP